MDRRSFLGLGLGAAALGALKGGAWGAPAQGDVVPLGGPLGGADSPLLKKVNFTKLTIDVGAKKPFKVIHCSDTHVNMMNVSDLIGAKRAKDLAMFDHRLKEMQASVGNFAACVLKARLENVPLIHSGDAWDYHSEENFHLVEDAFGAAGEVLYAMGNHEIRGHWEHEPNIDNEGVRRRCDRHLPNSSLFCARQFGGINFVAFDNCSKWNGIQAKLHTRIKAEFAKGLPTVLVMHKPIMTAASRKWCVEDHHAPENNLGAYLYAVDGAEKAFADWCCRQPNLKAVLCGHFHEEIQWKISDTVTQYVAGAVYKGNAYEITFV